MNAHYMNILEGPTENTFQYQSCSNQYSYITATIDQMPMCDVKGVVSSDKPKENDFLTFSFSSMGGFSIFKLSVLVSRPTKQVNLQFIITDAAGNLKNNTSD